MRSCVCVCKCELLYSMCVWIAAQHSCCMNRATRARQTLGDRMFISCSLWMTTNVYIYFTYTAHIYTIMRVCACSTSDVMLDCIACRRIVRSAPAPPASTLSVRVIECDRGRLFPHTYTYIRGAHWRTKILHIYMYRA